MKVQLENGNKSPFMNWKYNSDQKMKSSFKKNQGKSPIGKMEIKVPLQIGSIIIIRKWK